MKLRKRSGLYKTAAVLTLGAVVLGSKIRQAKLARALAQKPTWDSADVKRAAKLLAIAMDDDVERGVFNQIEEKTNKDNVCEEVVRELLVYSLETHSESVRAKEKGLDLFEHIGDEGKNRVNLVVVGKMEKFAKKADSHNKVKDCADILKKTVDEKSYVPNAKIADKLEDVLAYLIEEKEAPVIKDCLEILWICNKGNTVWGEILLYPKTREYAIGIVDDKIKSGAVRDIYDKEIFEDVEKITDDERAAMKVWLVARLIDNRNRDVAQIALEEAHKFDDVAPFINSASTHMPSWNGTDIQLSAFSLLLKAGEDFWVRQRAGLAFRDGNQEIRSQIFEAVVGEGDFYGDISLGQSTILINSIGQLSRTDDDLQQRAAGVMLYLAHGERSQAVRTLESVVADVERDILEGVGEVQFLAVRTSIILYVASIETKFQAVLKGKLEVARDEMLDIVSPGGTMDPIKMETAAGLLFGIQTVGIDVEFPDNVQIQVIRKRT